MSAEAAKTDADLQAKARRAREDTQLRLSVFVVSTVSLTWFLGAYGFSYMWCLFIVPLIFTVWYRKNVRIIDDRVREAEMKVHRRKALRDEETAEWLNFVLNRWWTFSDASLCNLVRSSLNPVLDYSKPSFIESMELVDFSFGKDTPFVKYVKVFENIDEGDSPNTPATEGNVFNPPFEEMAKRKRHQIVLNLELCLHAPNTKVCIRTRLGGKMVGADVDVMLEDVSLNGRAQIVLDLDHIVPFPHMKAVSVTFLEKPEVGFEVRMLRAVQVMDIPMLKDFINALVMDSLTYAMVDPGRIEIPLHSVDTEEKLKAPKKSTYADGVLTVTIRGGLPQKFTDDSIFVDLKLADQDEKSSEKIPGGTSFEESFTFLVYDLSTEKLVVEVRGKRSFGTKYTLAKYKIFLNALNLLKKKRVDTKLEKEGIKGSKLEVTLEYAALESLEVSSRTDEQEFTEKYGVPNPEDGCAGLLLVAVHSGSKLLSMDQDGFSDPYCIVTANREKVKTTAPVPRTVNPVWESIVEFPVKDFTKTTLSFLLYDRDVNWQSQSDDFMGSCNLQMSKETAIIKKKLDVNYKVFGKKKSDDTIMNAGSITVSAVFRPVEFVAKSVKDRDCAGVDEGNDIEDINEHAKKHTMKSSMKTKRHVDEMILIKERGVLVITLLQGKNMVAMDSNGLSDPFCVVRVNSEKKFKTNVSYETLTPVWNESVSVAMLQGEDKLHFDVFDKDVFQNDFMGTVSMTVSDIQDVCKKGPQWMKLTDVESGEIQVELKLANTGDESEAQTSDEVADRTSTHVAFGESGADSGIGDNPEQADGGLGLGMFEQTVEKLEDYIESQIPAVFHSLSGEVIQASDIGGWGSVMIKGRIAIPRKGRKGSVKYEHINMCSTPLMYPESGMVKWNYIFQTSGGKAVSNQASLIFELRDEKKKNVGISKIDIKDFFKGIFMKRPRANTTGSRAEEKLSETKWLNLEHDGMPVGRVQVMLSYSDTPDAPLAPTTKKRSLLRKRFGSTSDNL